MGRLEYHVSLYTLVLAGGQGTRLWPLSRQSRPKQFLELDGSGQTLLQNAARRASLLAGEWERVLVVCQANQVDLARQQLPGLQPANLILEPVGRSTAAAIGLGIVKIQSQVPEAILAVLPSDHLFVDELPWLEATRAAIELATETENLIVLGVLPAEPSSNYGYLQLGEVLGKRRGLPVYPVSKYVEKPDKLKAEKYIQSGNYLWNTGAFVGRLSVFQSTLERFLPNTYDGLKRLQIQPENLETIYPTLANISFDYAIMEKSSNLMVVQGDFQRIDVGSLTSLAQVWQKDENENAVMGLSLAKSSQKNIIYSDDGLVGLIGVEDMIVIRHKDVVLVCPKERAGDVKDLLALLNEGRLSNYR